MHGFRMHTVQLVCRHFVTVSQFVDVYHVGSSFHRGTHCVVVILADEYNGKFPEHGQVECFVEDPLTGSAIPEITKHHIVCAPVFFSECQSGSGADLSAYDPVATEEILFFAKEVHTASFTLRATCGFAIEFSHT